MLPFWKNKGDRMGHKHRRLLNNTCKHGDAYYALFMLLLFSWLHADTRRFIRFSVPSKALIQQPDEVQSRTGNRSSMQQWCFQIPQLVIYTAVAELCRDLSVGKHCNCFSSDFLITPRSESPKEGNGSSLVWAWPRYTCAKYVRWRPLLSKGPRFLLQLVCVLQEESLDLVLNNWIQEGGH